MHRYIIKRLLLLIPILLIVAILIFTLMYFVPGDPVSIALGADAATATEEQRAQLRAELGLDKPYLERLGIYLRDVFLRLDFGESYSYGTSVSDELLQRLPNTVQLTIMSIVIMVVLGVPIGVRAAVKANTLEDRFSMFLSLIFNAMPVFWFALLLVILFSLKLGWLPSYGDKSFKHFILPAIANSFGGVAGIARQTRSSMLEVIRSDYVVTARSKGLSERAVIYGHALPNALIPIITLIGSRFGHMLGGVVVIETVFTVAGIGSYLVNGINNRDYNVVQGSVIYIAFIFSIVMLITDLIYALVDPRIKAQYAKK